MKKLLLDSCTKTAFSLLYEQCDGVRALPRILKLMTFSQNWEIRLLFTKSPQNGWWQVFLLHSVKQWKTPSWKTNISEHDKIHKSLLRIFFCLS